MLDESSDIKITSRRKEATVAAISSFSSGFPHPLMLQRPRKGQNCRTKYSVTASASRKPEDRLLIILLDVKTTQFQLKDC
jgi:hypothetical protein